VPGGVKSLSAKLLRILPIIEPPSPQLDVEADGLTATPDLALQESRSGCHITMVYVPPGSRNPEPPLGITTSWKGFSVTTMTARMASCTSQYTFTMPGCRRSPVGSLLGNARDRTARRR